MPPSTSRPKVNAFPSQTPVTSRNQPLDPPNQKPPKTRNVNRSRTATASSQVLRPTGTYPGQLAPITNRISLPPAGEMTQQAEEHLRGAETREARRAAESTVERNAKKRSKRGDDVEDGDGEVELKDISGEAKEQPREKTAAARGRGRGRGKGKQTKEPGLMKVLEMQSRTAGYEVSKTGQLTYIPFTSRFVSCKVHRARQLGQQRVEGDLSPETATNEPEDKTPKDGKEKKSFFPLLALPETVKTCIYRLLEVETKLCIWPATKAGRQQPDVSLVCKEIREAVLPIYYGENTFAVDIAPPMAPANDTRAVANKTGSASIRTPPTGLAAVQKWAHVLSAGQNEDGQWFGLVKNWCFSYRNPLVGFGGGKFASNTTESIQDFVVSVGICEYRDRTGKEIEVGGVHQCARPGHIIEVHREAACIMPGWSDYGRCMTQKTPGALMFAVDNWLQGNREGSEVLGQFVLELRKMAEGLAADCCTKMPRGVELPDVLS
ncbi:hypothetical protein BST61_g2374 [Cercospora zeina]